MHSIKGTVLSIAVTSIVMGGYGVATHHFDRLAEQQRQQFEQLSQRIARIERTGSAGGAFPNSVLASDLAQQLDELRRDLAKLNRHQAQLQQSMDALQVDSAGTSTGFTAGIDAGAFEPADPAPTVAVEDRFQMDYLESGWGAAAESTLQGAFSEHRSDGVQVAGAECRSTMCRVDVRFEDTKSRMESMPFLATMIPWAAESHIRSDPEGEGAVVYVAREGYSLTGEIIAAPADEAPEGPG